VRRAILDHKAHWVLLARWAYKALQDRPDLAAQSLFTKPILLSLFHTAIPMDTAAPGRGLQNATTVILLSLERVAMIPVTPGHPILPH
jgi:hypothetical protein